MPEDVDYGTRSLLTLQAFDKLRSPSEIAPSLKAMIRSLSLGEASWPLLLFGSAGSGKTCVGLCIGDMASYRINSLFCDLPGLCLLLNQIRTSGLWTTGYPPRVRSEPDVWREWAHAGLAVLDEIGARAVVSDHHFETLKRALDLREGKPAVYISNLDPAQLTALYDDRIASRLASGTVVRLSGDRRLDKVRYVACDVAKILEAEGGEAKGD
jgi:DNA replication protein DnaC